MRYKFEKYNVILDTLFYFISINENLSQLHYIKLNVLYYIYMIILLKYIKILKYLL